MGDLQATSQSLAILRNSSVSSFQGGGEGPAFKARQDNKALGNKR